MKKIALAAVLFFGIRLGLRNGAGYDQDGCARKVCVAVPEERQLPVLGSVLG